LENSLLRKTHLRIPTKFIVIETEVESPKPSKDFGTKNVGINLIINVKTMRFIVIEKV
jgi:hypothetical protein